MIVDPTVLVYSRLADVAVRPVRSENHLTNEPVFWSLAFVLNLTGIVRCIGSYCSRIEFTLDRIQGLEGFRSAAT